MVSGLREPWEGKRGMKGKKGIRGNEGNLNVIMLCIPIIPPDFPLSFHSLLSCLRPALRDPYCHGVTRR